jgi:hypothetical protein
MAPFLPPALDAPDPPLARIPPAALDERPPEPLVAEPFAFMASPPVPLRRELPEPSLPHAQRPALLRAVNAQAVTTTHRCRVKPCELAD